MGVNMKISVVLATYNGQKYILEQIESIYNQSVKADEVIISDDASTDDTVQIVRKYIKENELDNSWRIYQNEKNLGYKANFRNAFTKVTGDIVILSDQDDIWEINKIQSFQEAFLKSSALAINTSFRFIDHNGEFLHSEDNNNNNNLLTHDVLPDEMEKISFETIIRNNISPGCTMAVCKALLVEYLQISKGILPHDWELNLIATIKDGLYFYNRKLTRYRIHGENEIGMTTNLNKAKLTPNLSYQQRCHNILERLKLKDFFECERIKCIIPDDKKSLFKKLHKYDTLRHYCVVKRKPWYWIYMVVYSIHIQKYHYVRLRELIGDLYFAIKR